MKDKKSKNKTEVESKEKPQAKVSYELCPRCEMNYMQSTESKCDICKAELGLVDSSNVLLPDFDEVADEKLCPKCGINYIEEDEVCCIVCAKDDKQDKCDAPETEEDWSKDITDDISVADDEVEPLSLSDLEADEEEMDDNDDGKIYKSVDDFEYVNPDDIAVVDDDEDEVDDDEFDL